MINKDNKMILSAVKEWERVFASLPDMIAILDNQYRILRVNEAMAKRIGMKAEECIGLLCYEAVHGLSQPPGFCPHSRMRKDGRPHFEEVHEERWGGDYTISVTPLTDETGVVIGAIHVARDITDRKRAERKLQESEAMLARAQQMAHVGHWYREISTGKGHWSDETYRIFGLKPQEREAHRQFFLEHIHHDDRVRVDKALRNAAEDVRPYNEIFRAVRPDGSVRWVHSKGEVTRNRDGEPEWIFGTILDITERKQMEDALREAHDELEVRVRERTAEIAEALKSLKKEVEVRKHSENLLSEARDLATALSATSDLQAALDLSLDKAIRVGDMAFGGIYLVDQASGHVHLAAHRNVPPDFLASIIDYDNTTPNFSLVAACRPVYAPWKDLGLFPAGLPDVMRAVAIVPICDEGRPVACLNMASAVRDDISESERTAIETIAAQTGSAFTRIQAEEERKKLATVVEHSEEGMIIVDAAFRIEYVNPAFAHMTGYRQKELVGNNAKLLQSEMMDHGRYETSREQVRSKGTVLVRSTAKKKDGTTIPVESFLSSIKDDNGNTVRYVLRCRDITEQVRLEEQLRQSQKMQAIGTLAGGIAHDFNNMLAVILGNAELALDDTKDSELRKNLKQILSASKRSRDLVKQILTFSRKSEGQKKVLKLSSVVQETATLLRGSLPSTIKIEIDASTDQDSILADPSQIQQILMNLSTNAAHAMSAAGGMLSISFSEAIFKEGDPRPERSMQPGRYVKLAVRDTGTGIPKKLRDRIFEPFFTTKEPGQGTGMGLAVVFGIISTLDGGITVDSKVGKGSTFTVFLPAYEGGAEEGPSEEAYFPTGKERVLVVDDEPFVAEVAAETLKRLGYATTTALSGTEGWKKFEDNPYNFDLVITDQVMPDITGMGLAEKVLKLRKNLPVILITGYSETVSPEMAKALGISQFLMKPIDKRTLAETVRRALDAREEE
ncbi:MAG: hybrid sensor histidine kinase/response regulator [Syntrophorhabdaceae bacterium]